MNILSKPSYHIPNGRHYLKMPAIPSSCSLHEKLQTPCGSSRDKESFVLLSERSSNISAHLANFHLSKMRRYHWSRADVGKRAGIIRGDSRVWLSAWDMDVHLENFGKRKSRASTLAGKILSVGGETSHNWRGRWNDCSVWQNRRCWFA